MTDERSVADVERETIVAERAGVLSLARRYGEQVDALAAAGRIKGDDAGELRTRILAFADMCATGMHRADADPAGVRTAMRAIIKGDAT